MIYGNAISAAQAVHQHLRGGPGFYAGITNDPGRRLFDEHGLCRGRDNYIAVKCQDDGVARTAEQILLLRGYRGGGGGGDESSTWIYAYQITSCTCEAC